MFRKLKNFFGIVDGRDTAVACKDCCGWDNGSEYSAFGGTIKTSAGCTVEVPSCKWTFHPEKGWIEKIHEVSPWKENRFGRCPYFEALRESGTSPGVVVCTPHKGGGFDLEIVDREGEFLSERTLINERQRSP